MIPSKSNRNHYFKAQNRHLPTQTTALRRSTIFLKKREHVIFTENQQITGVLPELIVKRIHG